MEVLMRLLRKYHRNLADYTQKQVPPPFLHSASGVSHIRRQVDSLEETIAILNLEDHHAYPAPNQGS